MASIYIAVLIKGETNYLYRQKPVETELVFLVIGSDFGFSYEDGSAWFGTVCWVTNYPLFNAIYVDVEVLEDVFLQLERENGWDKSPPSGAFYLASRPLLH